MDSYKFLSTILDKLISFLKIEKLKITQSEFSKLVTEDFNLLTQKDIFPYKYIDCVEKLKETRLLSRKSFYSSLIDMVFENDYAHAINIL